MDEATVSARSSPRAANTVAPSSSCGLAQLCVALAAQVDPEGTAILAAQVFDDDTPSMKALEQLERALPLLDSRALRTRYEAFLAQAGGHPAAGLVRDRLAALLFDHGLVYSALLQVDASLSELAASGPAWDTVALALRVQHADLDPDSTLDELERYLASESPYRYAEAAE